MKAPSVSVGGTGVLALVGVALAAYLLWKGSKLASGLVDAVTAPIKAAGAAIDAGTTAGNFSTPKNIAATFDTPDAGAEYQGGGNFGAGASDDVNMAYYGINGAGGALVQNPAGPGKNADGSWSLGGWLYDVTH